MKNQGVSNRVIVGLAMVVIGIGLLLLTTGVVSLGALAFPILLVAVGFVFLVRSFSPGRGASNTFVGTAVGLTGLLLLIRESVQPHIDLIRIWPLFMAVGGVSMVTYGFKSRGMHGTSFVVPGVVIILLSGIFLLFSLDVIDQSLATIVVQYWPILIISIGIVMLWPAGRGDESKRR